MGGGLDTLTPEGGCDPSPSKSTGKKLSHEKKKRPKIVWEDCKETALSEGGHLPEQHICLTRWTALVWGRFSTNFSPRFWSSGTK